VLFGVVDVRAVFALEAIHGDRRLVVGADRQGCLRERADLRREDLRARESPSSAVAP
jgi:hypothetical protein